jgi:acyl dehydratase
MSWFEDYTIGQCRDLGSYCFTEAEIIRFARKFDPQYFHVDPALAAAGPYGGLIASGWHTVAIWMKQLVASRAPVLETADGRRPASGPSPGFRDLKWPTPVRPNDTIRFTATVTEKLALPHRPNFGLIRGRNEGINQRGETVLSFIGQVMAERRIAVP